ncbi:glycosyltransferase family 2 protein [Cupriavidus gilardii]|uniref:Glycosyltransferase family 2 protein n=1 Tax=Cupriavidus gilardii TaxID=82541 RepID=A0A6N1BCC7_9BURK|nr:glycosyltransferase family 2 protein [Cupriavidus gilardii]ALD92148.1 glycosyl transferase family protein [Cupriavidus gilardii CR3]KAB0596940.1 glycosyltransferase family 2 protein [Cupriavidus gilardii]MCT9014920.1 glycosyltransferase family 2 protein [Cupriavidus gilardii]MCT9053332.1 glycosyltransferase family 2 protein [Cupriavidus gilardii]MCT9069863.1 glycosyltransferase family 2 protein [Cupriavidus gilardii]
MTAPLARSLPPQAVARPDTPQAAADGTHAVPCQTARVSVLILTLNEEKNLARCLESVSWSDDVVVLDSYSTDQTLEIARRHGARVFQRKFDNWSAHQNWANENIDFKHKWVYYSDADEVVSPELAAELREIADRVPGDEAAAPVAYRVRYKNYFLGKWIRFAGGYPIWVLRFFQPDKVRWERLVNPAPVVDGSVGFLRHHFLHYSFNKGFDAWFDKHNKYSMGEALETIRSLDEDKFRFSSLLASDPPARRRALKELSFRLPMRPVARFLYLYLLKFGFIDGKAGFHYCVLVSIYEYMVVLKVQEQRRRAMQLPL